MPIVEGVHFIYTVQQGDTLYSIARRFGSTAKLLEDTNTLYPPITDPGLIYPGQVLVVSETGINQRNQVSYIVHPGDSLYTIGLRFSASPELMAGMNPLLYQPGQIYAGSPLFVPAVLYDVEQGDTLYTLSKRLGISMNELIGANERRPGFSADLLFTGYRLIVPLPSSRNIVVYRPLPGTLIRPGQAVEGLARAFEASIIIQLMDDNGVVVTGERAVATSAGAPVYGSFSTALQFDRQPTAATGELWVYARSARDGRIIDLVQIRIRFAE